MSKNYTIFNDMVTSFSKGKEEIIESMDKLNIIFRNSLHETYNKAYEQGKIDGKEEITNLDEYKRGYKAAEERFAKHTSELVEKAKRENEELLKDKLEAEYIRGIEAAWDLATQITNSFTKEQIVDIFNMTGYDSIKNTETVACAVFDEWNGVNAMINYNDFIAKKNKEKIEVGDEVENKKTSKIMQNYVVTRIYGGDRQFMDCICLLTGEVMHGVCISTYRKTGKHYDLTKILASLLNQELNEVKNV